MADWTAKELVKTALNGGIKLIAGDGVLVEDINDIFESQIWVQVLANNFIVEQTNTTEPGGNASVTLSIDKSNAANPIPKFTFNIPRGEQGPIGVGIPTGGTANQILAKVDGTDYNTYWKDEKFTDTLLTKLNGIEDGAEVNNISDANASTLTGGGEAGSLHDHSALYSGNILKFSTSSTSNSSYQNIVMFNNRITSLANGTTATDAVNKGQLDLKENAANKSTDTALGTSDVLFPTQKAVKTYVDDKDTWKFLAYKANTTGSSTYTHTITSLVGYKEVRFFFGGTPESGNAPYQTITVTLALNPVTGAPLNLGFGKSFNILYLSDGANIGKRTIRVESATQVYVAAVVGQDSVLFDYLYIQVR